MSEHTPLTEAERIERLLAEHDWKWKAATPQRLVIVCSCGDELLPITSSAVATLDDHRAHVADLLAARTSTATADTGLREAAVALLKHFDKERDFWLDEVQRRNDTYGLAHRDLYRYYTEDNTDMARLRRALDAIAAPTTDTGARDE